MTLSQIDATPWGFACTMALLALPLIYSFYYFFRAVRPRRHTVEWIAFLDRPAATLSLSGGSLTWLDGICMAICALFAALVRFTAFQLDSGFRAVLHADLLDWLTLLLRDALAPALCVLALYCMARMLTTHRLFPLIAALLLSMDLAYDATTLMFWLLACAFFLHWWQICLHGSVGRCALPLLAVTAYLAVGTYFIPQMLICAVLLFVPLLFAAVFRAVRMPRRGRIPRLLATLGGYWLAFAFWMLCTQLPGAMLRWELPLWQVIFDGRFWRWFVLELQYALWMLRPSVPVLGTADTFQLIFSLLCALGCLDLAVRQRTLGALLPVWLFATEATLWLTGILPGIRCSALLCVHVWDRWHARGGQRALVLNIAYLVGMRLYCLVLLLLMFI